MSNHFQPEPKTILSTVAETLAWCEKHPRDFAEDARDINAYGSRMVRVSEGVKCLPVIEALDAIVARGQYPYNYEAEMEAMKRMGLPMGEWGTHKHRMADRQTALGWLVYRAQAFRRSDILRAEGYAPLTDAMVAEAFARKAKIEVSGENMLGGKAQATFNVREIGGRVYVMRPFMRKHAVAVVGQPARIVGGKMPVPAGAGAG